MPHPITTPITTPATSDGLLRELTEFECWTRLAHETVGRIAYADSRGPVVLPVNYVVQDGLIWIRTASYDQLAIHAPGQTVAFLVDHQDVHVRTGWSVLARGRASHVMRDDPQAANGWPDPDPWPSGNRSMVLCVTPQEVSGRALRQTSVGPRGGHGPGSVQRDTRAAVAHD